MWMYICKEVSNMQKEQLIYSGVPTFMGGDLIEARSIKKYDVVFLGVPTDYGSG